jgi:8-oxo-dGTP diphosphatase
MSILDTKFKVIPAAYTLLRRGDKVLLLRRANTGYRDGEYSLPAGHIDGDEPAIIAAAREVKEEIGIQVPVKNLHLVHTLHSKSFEPEAHERISFFFELSEWQGEPINAEPEKCDELRWVPITKLPREMVPEVRQVLTKVAANEPYSDFNF